MMAATTTQPVVPAAMPVARRAVVRVEQVPVAEQGVAGRRVQRAVVR
jgi:hypothetical protein